MQPEQRPTQHTTPCIRSSASPFIDDKYQVAHYWAKIGVTDRIRYPLQPRGYVGDRNHYNLVSISAPVDGSPVIWVIVKDTYDGYRRVFRFDLSQDKGHDFDGADPNGNGKHLSRDDCVGTEQLMAGSKPENGVYIMPSAHLNRIARDLVFGVGSRAFLRILRQQATAENAPLSIAKAHIWHRDFLAWGDLNRDPEVDTPIRSSASPLIRTAKQHAAYWKAASNPMFNVTTITTNGQTLRLIGASIRRVNDVDLIWANFFDDNQKLELTYKFDPRRDQGRDYTAEGSAARAVSPPHDDMVGVPIGETQHLIDEHKKRAPRVISSRLINDAARYASDARSYVKSLRGMREPAMLIYGDGTRGAAEADESSGDESEEEDEKKTTDSASVQFLRDTGPQPAEAEDEEDDLDESGPPEVAKCHCPGIEEGHFDVEQQEDHGDEVELHRLTLASVADGGHAALVGRTLLR